MLLTSSIFLIPNGTFFAELILFIIVLGVMAKFVLPPIQKALDERSRLVRASLQAGDEGRAEADRLAEEAAAIVAQARSEARATFEEVSRAGDELRAQARARADEERARVLADADAVIASERTSVRDEVMADVDRLVVEAAERVIGQKIEPSRHRALLDAALAEAREGGGAVMLAPVLAAADNFGESYVLEWIGLVLVALVFWRYILPHLRHAMAAQRERIRASLEAGAEAKAAAQRAVEEQRHAVAAARVEAEAILGQARQGADRLAEEGRRRAEDEYARLVARTENEIALLRARVRDEIGAELGAIVLSYASRIVQVELDARHQQRLVDEAIRAAEREAVS